MRVSPRFEDYHEKYRHARMVRDDGILEVTLHSDGRTWSGAAARMPRSVTCSRTALVHQIKKAMHDNLGYGLMLEGVAAIDHWPTHD